MLVDVEKVYGIAPPHWRDNKAIALSWIPEGDLAWTKLKPLNREEGQEPAGS